MGQISCSFLPLIIVFFSRAAFGKEFDHNIPVNSCFLLNVALNLKGQIDLLLVLPLVEQDFLVQFCLLQVASSSLTVCESAM